MKKQTIKNKLLIHIITSIFIFSVIITSLSSVLYYINLSSLTFKEINTVNEQTIYNLENYFLEINYLIDGIGTKVNNIDIKNNKEEISSYFDDIKNIKKEINNISIYEKEGDFILGDKSSTWTQNASSYTWFKEALNEDLVSIYSNLVLEEDYTYFRVSKYINFNKDKEDGVLTIILNFSNVLEILENSNLENESHIVIFDNNDEVIFFTNNTFISDDILIKDELILGNNTYKIDNINFNVFISTISYTGWKIGIYTDISEFDSIFKNILLILILMTILFTFIFIGVVIWISNNISRPIKLLEKEIREINSLNFNEGDLRVIKGNKEVEDLSINFILLMKRIKELNNKLILEEEIQKETELIALQNQINPHFLYNTLDSIIYLIEINDNKKATKMLLDLSKFFRISISKGKNIITLDEELNHAVSYLEIQKIRYNELFNYEVKFDSKLKDFRVPKLILQPLIENSIEHGLKEKEEVGNIIIDIYSLNDYVYLNIVDNGLGISKEKINEIYDSFLNSSNAKSVGIINVYKRIKVYYGDNAKFNIESNDESTTISLVLPLIGVIKNE